MKRILVTGSRDWTNTLVIATSIQRYLAATCTMLLDERGQPVGRDVSDVVLVHGGARGADQLAATWAEGCSPPIKTEPHPVTARMWEENPRIAGYMRNIDMVALGADVCIAFLRPCSKPTCRRLEPHYSHGGSHTADLAEESGITTIRVPER